MERKLVIDVSHWNGDVDYKAWRDIRGLWGVIVKFGGNETSLGRYKDSKAEDNYRKAKAAGLHVGAYYYTVSTDTANARADAEHFDSLLKGHDFDLPCYFDIEDQRQFGLSKRLLTDVIRVMCDTLKAKGWYSGFYTGGNAFLNNMYRGELYQYANWVAWWRGSWPSECGDIGMWQQGGMRFSDGDIVYADKVGYTDCDWCVVDYPSIIKGGSMGLSYSNAAAEVMWHKVTHDQHGYSQPNRSTNYTDKEQITLSDGERVSIAKWDDDCSSAVRDCYLSVGVNVGRFTYTGNEAQGLLESGNFKRIGVSQAQNGDILLTSGHTEMCIVRDGKRYQAGFRHGDYKGGLDGRTGDQDGTEATYSTFYAGSWTEAFRCIKEREVHMPFVEYQAHVQNEGWQRWVCDGQTAGTTGKGLRLEGLHVKWPEKFSAKATVHLQNVGNVTYDGMDQKLLIGTVEEARRLEAVTFIETKNETGKSLRYRVHVQNEGWQEWKKSGELAGTTGKALRIEAIEIKFV